MESYRRVGHRVTDHERSALVFDAMLENSPIVGASRGFAELTQRTFEAVLGRGWRILLEGLPESAVGRSTCQDIDDFLRMARLRHIDAMADSLAVLGACRADGSTFTYHSSMRLVKVPKPDGQPHVYVVAVQTNLGDMATSLEHRRQVIREDCLHLDELMRLIGEPGDCWQPLLADPEFSKPLHFFPSPLSFKCVLSCCMSTGMRREPHQVPRGCVLMSSSSICLEGDAAFYQITVERTLANWTSKLPFIGFTCTTPEEVESDRCFFGESPHAFCLGQSVTIGGTGEAWMRLEADAMRPLIGQRLEDHAQRKHLTPDLPEHKRRAPLELGAGDLLGCLYKRLPPGGDASLRSSVTLFVNSEKAFEFEFDASLPNKPLYAVVDVCYSVYQVSLMTRKEVDAVSGG